MDILVASKTSGFDEWNSTLDEMDRCSIQSEVKSFSHVRLFGTPWTVAYQSSPSMGFSWQEYQSGLPFPSPGYLPNPGLEPRSPTLRADALPSEPPGKLVQESHRDRFKGTRKVRMLSSSPSSLGSFSSLGIQKSQAKEWSHIFLCLKWLHSLNFQKWKRLDCFSAVTTFLWFMSIL